jgi:hypothetical protein
MQNNQVNEQQVIDRPRMFAPWGPQQPNDFPPPPPPPMMQQQQQNGPPDFMEKLTFC